MKTKDLTRLAMFIALVFVATNVKFVLPFIPGTGGLVHFGNIAAFSIAIVYGKKYGALSGAFGMALFDLLTGYAIWAPGTFLIRFLSGYAVGYIAYNFKERNGYKVKHNLVAMVVGSLIIIAGYFLYQGIVIFQFKDWHTPLVSATGDVTQSVIGILGALYLTPHLIKLREIYENEE